MDPAVRTLPHTVAGTSILSPASPPAVAYRHPLNVEPPPEILAQGFITPTSLHYVRNHGAVPRISWEQHRVAVKGLVDRPTVFTMDELVHGFEEVTIVATLTCAGNRRKEQNMVKKTIGFNWGPSGTACGEWTGVRLADVLRRCQMSSVEDSANYVCFRGPQGELPQGWPWPGGAVEQVEPPTA